MRTWFIAQHPASMIETAGKTNGYDPPITTGNRAWKETLQKGIISIHKHQFLDNNCFVLLTKEQTTLVFD
jgi:hypothetical protein